MKKKKLFIVLFLSAFIASYLTICFAIPGMRIKLEAEPMEYFLKSITHMIFIKSLMSLVIALIVGTFPLFIKKR